MKKALIVFGLLIQSILLLPAFIKAPAQTTTEAPVHAKILAHALSTALLEYREKEGRFPEGEGGQIMDALLAGGFFEPARESLNDHGEIIDPWGTPFRIGFNAGNTHPIIHSAGPNLIFEEHSKKSFLAGDDYTYPE